MQLDTERPRQDAEDVNLSQAKTWVDELSR